MRKMTKKMKYKTPKKSLSYSEMTDTVYWHDGRGAKTNVNDQFMFVLGLMAKTLKGFKFNMTNKENPEDSFSVEVVKVPYEEAKDEDDKEVKEDDDKT